MTSILGLDRVADEHEQTERHAIDANECAPGPLDLAKADRDTARNHRRRMHAGSLRKYLPFCWRYLLIQCREKSRKTSEQSLLNGSEVTMHFQVKVFNWQDQAKHVVVIARGCMEKGRFKKLFEEIERATQGLHQCKVLVDLSESTYAVNSVEIDSLVAELPLDGWPRSNRIAFVSASGTADYHRLQFLRTGIVHHGLSAAVFHDSKIAIDWLAGVK